MTFALVDASPLYTCFSFADPVSVNEAVAFTPIMHYNYELLYPYAFWDFGDGTTAPLSTTTHTYTQTGTYQVTLFYDYFDPPKLPLPYEQSSAWIHVVASPTATLTPTVEPTATSTPEPTVEPTATPTLTPEPTVEPTATPTLTSEPTIESTATPTLTPEPTVEPTATPTLTPEPTVEPTVTTIPTVSPTQTPAATPSPRWTIWIPSLRQDS